MAELILRGVCKSFGTTEVLRDIGLQLRPREFVVFVGPSGCGKSTLLRLIAGLEDVTSGELLIDGERANELKPRQRGVAMVFQSYALYPHMTAYENMAFGLELSRHTRAGIDERVRRAAATLGLTPVLQRRPRELSGGQRQRVAIGRAIVREPRFFLFDEPLSNLDASLRVQTRVELARLHRELGATTLYVTHDQAEAMTLGDRIVVLNGGRVEQVGAPLELYHRPANRFVAGFIGSPPMNFIEARVASVSGSRVELALAGGSAIELGPEAFDAAASRALRAGDPVTLGIRPEHVQLDVPAGRDATLDLPCQVVEQMGDSHLLHARLPQGGTFTLRGSGDARHRPGDRLRLALPAAHCHLFAVDGLALAAAQPRATG